MSTNTISPVAKPLSQSRADIRQELLNDVMLVWHQHYPGLVGEDELRRHAGRLLDELVITFAAQLGDASPDLAAEGPLAATAREFRDRCLKAGFKPAETAKYALAMKNIITGRLLSELSESSSDWIGCLTRADEILERDPLLTFEDHRRGWSLVELFTPIIGLRDQLLMLPLVGVIDTLRERQIAELLLDAITHCKAKVIIIDVTGVPVFDTKAIHHVLKTVDVALQLGTRVVMTGISAQDAQTLTQAGAGFARVGTCATLRAALTEAVQMISPGASVAESVDFDLAG